MPASDPIKGPVAGATRPNSPLPPRLQPDQPGSVPLKPLCVALGFLVVCFSVPLFQLTRFALSSELYSYIVLIPFISAYLIWTKRNYMSVSRPASRLALAFGIGAVLLLSAWWFKRPIPSVPQNDLCIVTISFLLLGLAACARFLGMQFLRSAAFPLGFLFFMVPLPLFAQNAIETFLQHRSADAAFALFQLAGTPLLRDGTVFALPGISIEVAPECSGIRSTFILVITSLLAGQFFLRRTWSKAVLLPTIVVLGILRNAIRIFTIGQLCIHISPSMIDSPIHHRGGPVFFVASLVPFFLLIWYLRKLELRKEAIKPSV